MKTEVVVAFVFCMFFAAVGFALVLGNAVSFLVRAIAAVFCFILAALSWGIAFEYLAED